MKEDLRKIGNRYSYTFGNNTTLHLYSKPDEKTKKKLKKTIYCINTQKFNI